MAFGFARNIGSSSSLQDCRASQQRRHVSLPRPDEAPAPGQQSKARPKRPKICCSELAKSKSSGPSAVLPQHSDQVGSWGMPEHHARTCSDAGVEPHIEFSCFMNSFLEGRCRTCNPDNAFAFWLKVSRPRTALRLPGFFIQGHGMAAQATRDGWSCAGPWRISTFASPKTRPMLASMGLGR